jgi:hypothetical protein
MHVPPQILTHTARHPPTGCTAFRIPYRATSAAVRQLQISNLQRQLPISGSVELTTCLLFRCG